MVTHSKWFWPAALITAWLADFLFWGRVPGISFPIWIGVALLAGFLLSWRAGKRPSLWTILLAVLTFFFSWVFAFRINAMTNFVSGLMVAGGLVLITATFLNGHWTTFRMVDYLTEGVKVIWAGFSRPFLSFSTPAAPDAEGQVPQKSFWKRFAPILRGLLITIPVVAIFAALFASADPVFNEGLRRLFNIERLPEYILRLVLILLLGFWLVGMYLHAIFPSSEGERPDPAKSWMKPFLGWTESGILLGALNLLFIVFVILQIRYLFGGSANINETGFTYADYARRGFNELVWVAGLSLMLFLLLSTITKLEKRSHQVGFTALVVLLMANVLVILASSLARLFLYESAYGFTQLRTVTHIFIFWLGGLVLAAAVLELLRQRGRFALVLLVAAIGFSMTLAVINVDAFVVRKNVNRAMVGEKLDVAYLNTLTDDAVPAMMNYYKDPAYAGVHEALGVTLACRVAEMQKAPVLQWQSYHFSRAKAHQLLAENSALLNQVKLQKDANNYSFAEVNGEAVYCNNYNAMD